MLSLCLEKRTPAKLQIWFLNSLGGESDNDVLKENGPGFVSYSLCFPLDFKLRTEPSQYMFHNIQTPFVELFIYLGVPPMAE